MYANRGQCGRTCTQEQSGRGGCGERPIDGDCATEAWPFCRLDGSTQNSLRQSIVDAFNAPKSKSFVFLLSSKAGGCGLNLIGANRIVLFDPAWNPATDRQAMARVWRDGQKKQVYIYRMLSTGTVEERIFQRQILKEEVAKAVVDREDDRRSSSMGSGGRHFSPNELRKLFAAPKDTICDTYDLISQLKLAKTPGKRGNVTMKKKMKRGKVRAKAKEIELSDSDSNFADLLDENSTSSHSDDSDDSNNSDNDSGDDGDGKASARRMFLFPMYRGPSSVKDTVLRNVIEAGEDNNLVTFVRTESIYPGGGGAERTG